MTHVEEFVKSWTIVEELVCLQTLLRMFPLRILVLLRRTPLGKVENSVESVDSCLGKKFRSLGFPLLYWGVEVELMSGWVQASQ